MLLRPAPKQPSAPRRIPIRASKATDPHGKRWYRPQEYEPTTGARHWVAPALFCRKSWQEAGLGDEQRGAFIRAWEALWLAPAVHAAVDLLPSVCPGTEQCPIYTEWVLEVDTQEWPYAQDPRAARLPLALKKELRAQINAPENAPGLDIPFLWLMIQPSANNWGRRAFAFFDDQRVNRTPEVSSALNLHTPTPKRRAVLLPDLPFAELEKLLQPWLPNTELNSGLPR